MFRVLFLIAAVAVFFIGGCNAINPSERVPTYVHIDSFRFIPTIGSGTASHKIVSVTAYIDNQPIGTFDLPANIPVLIEKPGTLMLVPCVMYSGLNDVLVPYNFYKADTSTLSPSPAKVVVKNPTTQYWGDSVLTFTIEDFESGNSFVQLSGDTIVRTTDPNFVFEGKYGGVIRIHDTSYAENIMTKTFQAPQQSANKAEAYLELNYKGNRPFSIGVQTTISGVDVSEYQYGFNPRSDWNKVYVGLQDFLSAYPLKTYRIMVKVLNDSLSPGWVAFDNFKVVTRK
ncbi:MAG: hypothetical protein JST52_11760 [Bacteroidetes bacterium]|nr:hypothetical protein [Bacteroidota bacterium]MBS1774863.1 hypothetical protein [Bacteroidota bacterium]